MYRPLHIASLAAFFPLAFSLAAQQQPNPLAPYIKEDATVLVLEHVTLIDGTGSVDRFFRITLPLIMPSVTVAVFYSLSNALKTFDVIFSLTFGGPGTATTSIALDIYKTAFSDSRFGYGTAKSVVLFLLIFAVTVFQLNAFKRREVES